MKMEIGKFFFFGIEALRVENYLKINPFIDGIKKLFF
jgi:hypothetical protein